MRLPVWLTEPEWKKLLAGDMTDRNRAIITLFLLSGLRSNELRMLDVADVDFEEMTVMVRFGKGGKQRVVPLHRRAMTALRGWLGQRESGPLFLNRFGQRLSNRYLRMLIKQLSDAAGLRKDVHPHALRHTFAVALLETNVDLETIRELLGHNSITTTSIYLHCSPSRRRAAIDRLEA